ncbi:hypothetical protein A3860_08070 [Niastella vici]|uniref:Uncharacterized protein n=1 Tax=Niastella vici TaxID=1703345 RepID=A0A1V9FJ75_9BACT|nr:hypothetical protein [Niastella vici]OQP58266.1 hypothetical protein A3860_08070 [Niastella vici]
MKILSRSVGFVALLALITIAPSCNKLKDLVTINVPLQTADVDFSIAPQPAGTQTLSSFQFGINVDSVLKKENSSLGIGSIKKVKVKSITLTLSNATQADNFGALSACEASIASNNKPDYVVFAGLTSNPETYATTLDIPVKDVDLKDYFGSTVLYYKLSGTTRRATTTTLTGKATIKFDIEAGL